MSKLNLVNKVRASGYALNQRIKPLKVPTLNMTKEKYMNTSATMKGKSIALVKRDGMPVSYEPHRAPRSKTLAQLGKEIRNV